MKPSNKSKLKRMRIKDVFSNPATHFWDIDTSIINPYYHHKFIIFRILYLLNGQESLLKELGALYSDKLIMKTLKKRQKEIKKIDTFRIIGNTYNIDPKQFLMYRMLVLTQENGSPADVFPMTMFWDTNESKLDWMSDRNYILAKVFMLADKHTLDDFLPQLEYVYSKEQIYNGLKNNNEYLRLNMEVCNALAKQFNMSPLFTNEKINVARKNKKLIYIPHSLKEVKKN